jgi:hypothetical protein
MPDKMNNTHFGMNGEKQARKMLRKHFTNVRRQGHLKPFDYTAIDKLTGQRVAIEVKTITKDKGKLVHIETCAFERKLKFLNETNRQGIILVAVKNGDTQYYLTRLQQHISRGMLVELTL